VNDYDGAVPAVADAEVVEPLMRTLFDPADPAMLRDPYDIFARMRAESPVHWSPGLSAWLAVDWNSVQTALTNPETYSANRLIPMYERLREPDKSTAADVLRWLSLWMVFQDPPNHTRLRRHIAQVINPGMTESLRGAIKEITSELLDALPEGEPFDFYTDFALTLPGYVVMDLLGVPRDRLDEVKQWADEMMLFIGSARGVEDKYGRARHGAESMAALFRKLIAERRAEPRDDVLTKLIISAVDGETLTDDELIASMMMIGNGAQETTAHLLSNSLLALKSHPDALAELRADADGLIVSAVEEFLRFDGPVLSTGRLVVQDTELGGEHLAEGDRVFAILAAANRDPAVFENPDEITLRGRTNGHLAFSKGAHFCLGAPIARLEVQIAISEIVRRYPDFSIVEPLDDIPWTNSLVTRGPTRLPLRLA
jgi:cytochrome P450